MKSKIYFLCLLVFFCSFGEAIVFAQSSRPAQPPKIIEGTRPINLDGYSISIYHFIWDFAEVTLPVKTWGQSSGSYNLGNSYTPVPENFKKDEDKHYPAYNFFENFIDRSKGLPRHNVINKWEKKKIRISIGWPWDRNESDPIYDSFQTYAEFFLPIISKATGKQFEINTQNPDIIIAPVSVQALPKNIRISNLTDRHYGLAQYPWWFEQFITAGIKFTPDQQVPSENQSVDGTLLSDQNNIIQKSYCLIDTHLEPERRKTFIKECLLRSMGLPNPSSNRGSALNAYNNDPKFSKKVSEVRNPAAIIKTSSLVKLIEEIKEDGSKIPEYDFLLLKTLYCDDLKAGDDKNILTDKFLNKDSCSLVKYFKE